MSNASRVVISAFFSVAAKFLGKTLGLISTFIVARLLAPVDFGFIAIVSMTLYFFDILSHAAGEQYVIQKKVVTFLDLHTAWTLNLLLKVAIALGVFACAGLLAGLFDAAHLSDAIKVSAVILPLQALKNHKLMLLKRQLRFQPLFWLSLLERLFALPILITLAVILGNFWAFLITDISVAVFALVLSFVVIKGKPFFTLKKLKQQWSFSQWMLGKHLLGYLRSQIDTFVVAKWFPASLLGNYHMARDLAMMPAHYLLSPAIEPLLAIFKNDKNNEHQLLNNVAFSLLVVFIISIPILAALAFYAKPIVYMLLGEKWTVAAELLPILSILFFYWCVIQVLDAALIAMGKVQFLFVFDFVSLTSVLIALVTAIWLELDLLHLAWVRSISGLLLAILLLVWMFKGNGKLLRPVALLFLTFAVGASLAMIPTLLVPGGQFPEANATYVHYIKSIAELMVFGTFYIFFVALALGLSKQYHLVRFKSLIFQHLPQRLRYFG
ncbi:oligosaccharide flippase family protein [Alteromonas genovensis]|uniref:oligosaccharide flippase family protein n=1 Tax=Alteromonas genovensis TaxID=471225 RepID=UPI002FDFD270